jgi:multisubunit Na+/H+ antiporter MnhB subunit
LTSQLIGYIWLRRLIGIVGMVFPLALLATVLVFGGPVPQSISDYYYEPGLSRSIFDASLGLIAAFLMCYQGYDRDYIPMKIAAGAMFGVIIFPTVPVHPTWWNNFWGIFHGVSAATTFITLSIISFFLFTKTKKVKWRYSPTGRERILPTKRKLQRNVIYRICGISMWGAMVLIYPLTHWVHVPQAMYWLESIIVEAFAISWLVKGETILRDRINEKVGIQFYWHKEAVA